MSIPIAVAVGLALPEVAPLPPVAGKRRLPFALPSASMIGLVIFAFGAVMGEVAARSWSAVYLRDVILASPGSAGFGYAAFSLFMAGGRFLGDWATVRFGTVPHRTSLLHDRGGGHGAGRCRQQPRRGHRRLCRARFRPVAGLPVVGDLCRRHAATDPRR